MKTLLYILISISILSINIFSQHDSSETDSSVPELYAFHEIIYPIWHTAYPAKDYEALRSYVDDVNSLAVAVYDAELPGILRDKKGKWLDGLKSFKAAVDSYNDAASGENDQKLLKAAEDLHSKFEKLVRIIRPVSNEVDEFHKTLYVIYHYYLPDEDYDKIKELGDELVAKAEAVTNATLSKRLEDKQEKFNAAAEELLMSAKELNKILKENNDKEKIAEAVEIMHTKYQNVEAIFD